MSTTADEVKAFLASLGETGDAVAEALRALDVKGSMLRARKCPLSGAIRARFASLMGVGTTVYYSDVEPVGGGSERVNHPPGCAEFVVRFDRGDYPDLVG